MRLCKSSIAIYTVRITMFLVAHFVFCSAASSLLQIWIWFFIYRNGTIATDLVFLFKAVEKLDAIRCRWPATKSSFDSGECAKNLSSKMYFPRSFLNLQNENAIQSIKIFEATSPITYTTVCKCISIENNGTEVDHTNLDFLNLKHVDFRISTSTKVMLHQKYISKKWSHGLHITIFVE